MTDAQHNPNCAIVRTGDIRAWCDCGAEMPALNEIRANVAEKIGAGKERGRTARAVERRIASLRDREAVCWEMAEVFLMSKDAHGLHDMGVEIQGIQWAIRELEKLTNETDKTDTDTD